MTNQIDIEKCKSIAARMAVEENIHDDCILGIGSGSTMTYVLDALVHRCKEKNLSVKCIPTSFQSEQLIHDYNLPLTKIRYNPEIDITIDGADEVDNNLVAIKGGGACLFQEKVVAFAAKRFVVVADYRKNSVHLGESWHKGVPIEVLPMANRAVMLNISRTLNVPIDDIVIRIGNDKAGPVITDNGNFVLDWKFKTDNISKYSVADWKSVADKIKLIPGVVETGIFAGMIHAAYFGQPDGQVIKR